MSDPRADLARSWLKKARRDLDSAKKLSLRPDPYFDTALFHCQQAAEKSVKGYLAYQKQVVGKTHDIVKLMQAAAEFEKGFSSLFDVGDELTNFDTMFRYPGEIDEPSADTFESAVSAAERIISFVLGLLPKEARPE